MKRTLVVLIILCACLPGCRKTAKQITSDTLSDALFGFENIQDSTRTKTWWFHGDTETTKEGITADLESFRRVGIGGIVYYDQSHGRAEHAFPGFSPEWWEMLRFSAEEAKRLDLTFETHISNGFVAGGSWITDEMSMKRLVATETTIVGGRYYEGMLEAPANRYNFYKDVAVIAFPAPKGGGITSLTEPVKISSNVKGIDLDNLFNPRSETLSRIPISGNPVFINLEFENDFTARSITYDVRAKGKATTSATNVPAPPQETFVGTGYRILPDLGQLEVSQDGIEYTKVCDLKPIYIAHENWRQKTISFPAVKGRFYRLCLHDWWEDTDRDPDMQIGRVVINSVAKLDQWEEKAGLFSEYIENDRTPEYGGAEAIDASRIIDVSDMMSPDGSFRWDVPDGNWTIMRFAYVPTGGSTKHGRRNLLGRECDKLSAAAAEFQWKNYMGRIIDSLKLSNSGELSGVVVDSHEAGSQNWSDHFIEEFVERQGYNPILMLPAMMGYVITDVETSTGFLFDVRRNIADMIADNYFGTFEKLSKENNLILTAQAIGNALCIVGDPIQAKSKVTKPQGEFWPIHPDGNYDIKESSSAAHLYGKYIASAEAFTDAKYSASPANLKSLADYAYAFGINEFVICAIAHQPWLDRFPGNTGGGREYGLGRTTPWWEYSAPFWDYQARSTYIMRLGKSAIDLCVYLGENAPVKILTYRLPEIPGGFDFDAFTSDALHTRMEANNGKITLPDGVSYKMMILPRSGDITLDALEKIAEMVRQGITIYGPKPVHSGSGRDIGREKEYLRITNKLWGERPAATGSNKYGRGTVYWGMPLDEALTQAHITPDIAMKTGNTKDNMIYFAHRKLADADVYFIANRKDKAEETTFTFDAKGKNVQLWNPVTGERHALTPKRTEGHGTSVDLYMAPRESFFVMITDKGEELPQVDRYRPSDRHETIEGSWEVYFDEKKGGPGKVVFDSLADWTGNSDPRIKHYSGTAIYRKTIEFDPAGDRIYIDLGDPGAIARVFVNSQDAGVVWCSPWNLDITDFLRSGENALEIHVANLLTNRLNYDASLPESERVTYSSPLIGSPGADLIPSGLKQVKMVRK